MDLRTENIVLNGSGITLAINPKSYTANFDFDDISPENYVPKEGEFIEVQARALSNVIVAPNTYRATEFPAEVLQMAKDFLVNKNFFSDHFTYTGNSIGLITAANWQDSYVQDGEIIPAGINVILKIDTVAEPKMARKILSGELAAVSVGVEFTWLPSHAFEDVWEFYEKLGTKGDDGQMIRRIAKEILNFRELSLVPIGADPFACVIKEGRLTRIDKARADKSMLSLFSDSQTYEPKKAGSDGDKKEVIAALQKETLMFAQYEHNRTKKQTNKNMDKEFLSFLGLQEGATFEDAKAVFSAAKAEKETLQVKLTEAEATAKELQAAKESAEALLSDAKLSVAKYEQYAERYNKEIATRRERIKAAYQATNNASSAILSLIDKAEDEELTGLENEFGAGLVQNLGLCCEKCGGEKFTSKKSQPDPNDSDNGEGEEKEAFVLLKEHYGY